MLLLLIRLSMTPSGQIRASTSPVLTGIHAAIHHLHLSDAALRTLARMGVRLVIYVLLPGVIHAGIS